MGVSVGVGREENGRCLEQRGSCTVDVEVAVDVHRDCVNGGRGSCESIGGAS